MTNLALQDCFRHWVIAASLVTLGVIGVTLWVNYEQRKYAAQESLFREQWVAEQMTALRSGAQSGIRFYSTSDTDRLINRFAGMSEIKTLSFELTDLSGVGLRVIRSLPNIEEISVYGGRTPIGDDELALLEGKTSIRNLKFINTRVTDNGLHVLGSFPELTQLTLYRDGFRPVTLTDSAIQHLQNLKALRRLEIGGGWLSDAAIDDLRRLLPDSQVVVLRESPVVPVPPKNPVGDGERGGQDKRE